MPYRVSLCHIAAIGLRRCRVKLRRAPLKCARMAVGAARSARHPVQRHRRRSTAQMAVISRHAVQPCLRDVPCFNHVGVGQRRDLVALLSVTSTDAPAGSGCLAPTGCVPPAAATIAIALTFASRISLSIHLPGVLIGRELVTQLDDLCRHRVQGFRRCMSQMARPGDQVGDHSVI